MKRIESYILSINAYYSYLTKHNKHLLKLDGDVISFKININRKSLLEETPKKIKEIKSLLSDVSNLINENQKYEILHVEDGSLEFFIGLSALAKMILVPFIDTVTHAMNGYLDITHKMRMQDLEYQTKLETLRESSTTIDLTSEISKYERLIELNNKKMENEKTKGEEKIIEEINHTAEKLKIEFEKEINQAGQENKELLLDQIARKVFEHFKNFGTMEILKIDYHDEQLDEEQQNNKFDYKRYEEKVSQIETSSQFLIGLEKSEDIKDEDS